MEIGRRKLFKAIGAVAGALMFHAKRPDRSHVWCVRNIHAHETVVIRENHVGCVFDHCRLSWHPTSGRIEKSILNECKWA